MLSAHSKMLSAVLGAGGFLAGPRLCAQTLPSVDTFASKAYELLPVEQRYDYHRRLAYGHVHAPARNPDETAASHEISIDSDWKLLIPESASPLLQHAADDFADYLEKSMGEKVSVKSIATPLDLKEWPKTILAGTRKDLPELASSLRRTKDYRIVVSGENVIVCGYDDRGTMYGLYNLEDRLNLREGPFLASDTDTTRHSLFDTRMALSWLGWMEWPDNLLDHMVHDGFDAIFASVYANPNGAPGPELRASDLYSLILNRNKRQDATRMKDLVRRAGRLGIKVYAPIIYRYTEEPGNEDGLRRLVKDIIQEFPEIKGYVLLTEGFYVDDWGHRENLEEWTDKWTRAVGVVTEEAHAINPEIEILAWEYNIDFRPKQVDLKRQVIRHLPQDSIPLLTWENGKSFEIDGLRGYLRDYSINQIGPAEVTKAQIEEARNRGMRVYSKVDTFASWQFGTTPYIPAPYQWYKRYQALEQYGVNGTLESWSNGYKPNMIAELRSWSCWTDSPELDVLLRGMARRDFGEGNEENVLQAWKLFSDAIENLPDTGPSMGTNQALANPLFFREGVPRAMMLEHSWRDPAKWKGHIGGNINPYWPYTVIRMVFYPDFSNRQNRAEEYALAWSGIGGLDELQRPDPARVLQIFLKYLKRTADGFEEGLRHYRQAALAAPSRKQPHAFKEVLMVEQMQRMLRSNHAILEFEDLRFRLSDSSKEEKRRILHRMSDILKDEIARTQHSLKTALRHSGLGYEFEHDYIYTPYVLEEKLTLLHKTLNDYIPEYQRQHGL